MNEYLYSWPKVNTCVCESKIKQRGAWTNENNRINLVNEPNTPSGTCPVDFPTCLITYIHTHETRRDETIPAEPRSTRPPSQEYGELGIVLYCEKTEKKYYYYFSKGGGLVWNICLSLYYYS